MLSNILFIFGMVCIVVDIVHLLVNCAKDKKVNDLVAIIPMLTGMFLVMLSVRLRLF